MFEWLVFIALCIILARDFGLPLRLAQVIYGVVLLLILLLCLLGLAARVHG